jgi:hypothetical protein
VLEAALWSLNTGAQWHMLPQSYPNYKIGAIANQVLRLGFDHVEVEAQLAPSGLRDAATRFCGEC